MGNEYWNKRGLLSYTYKGEKFYTITPLPYYLKRREQLLKKIDEVIKQIYHRNIHNFRIADFGSGDGYYCCWLAKRYPEFSIYGFDITKSMVDKAKKKADSSNISNVRFFCKDMVQNENGKFDLLLILTVFQHFMDENIVKQKISQLYKVTAKNSRIILFEATAKKTTRENKLIMRPEHFYIKTFQNNHFKLSEKEYMSFPFFCMYQKVFLKTIKKILPGTKTEKSIWINKNKFFKRLNQIVFSAGCFMDRFIGEGKEGYTLFVFKKIS